MIVDNLVVLVCPAKSTSHGIQVKMGTKLTKFGSESGVPGLSTITSSSGLRKLFWTAVVLLFIGLTVHDLIDLVEDYVQYPVTVNVRVADSRVLSFPAVTICNLNLVHRGRFCASKEIDKPEIIENILCANIGDLLNSCEISNMMDELLEKGQETCGVKVTEGGGGGGGDSSSPVVGPPSASGSSSTSTGGGGRRRGKRQLQLRDIIKTVREVGTAIRGDGQKGSSIIDIYNDFQDNLKKLADGTGGPLDETLTQAAKFLGFNVSNSLDIIPALFMKAFTDTTGCRLGSSDMSTILPENVRTTLKSLAKTFMVSRTFYQNFVFNDYFTFLHPLFLLRTTNVFSRHLVLSASSMIRHSE